MESTRSETRALAKLALAELAGAADGAEKVHRAISDRVFAGVRLGGGRRGGTVKSVHDAIAGGVYRAVSQTASAAAELADTAPGLDRVPPPSRSTRGAPALAVLHGLRGDALAGEGSALVEPASVRVANAPVPIEPDALAAAFPDAGARIVVFLHGLMETEHAWRIGGSATYGERLGTDLGYTTVSIRYNTGRHISDNGAEVARLLDALVAHWPVPVTEIALIGHSMGGLIARSACHLAGDAEWVRLVRVTVSLGSPHFGAPLEQLVHYGSAALHALPETRPFANLLRRRSAGIRDLRAGSLVEQDWQGRDADSLARIAVQEVPLLPTAAHYFVSASITRSPRHPVGRIIGDGLVLVPSASGRNRARRLGFDDRNGLHVGSISHFRLLNNETVYAALRTWLDVSADI